MSDDLFRAIEEMAYQSSRRLRAARDFDELWELRPPKRHWESLREALRASLPTALFALWDRDPVPANEQLSNIDAEPVKTGAIWTVQIVLDSHALHAIRASFQLADDMTWHPIIVLSHGFRWTGTRNSVDICASNDPTVVVAALMY